MSRWSRTDWWVVFCVLVFAFPGAYAETQPAPGYEPHMGQAGKDVVWVPTEQALVDRMLDIAKVTPDDFVMDLGSGDGRTVISAARRGARALGIEYNPDMVALSIRNAEKEGVSDKASFMNADLFETDFSKATVITMFLLPSINLRLRPILLDLKPGTRIVSNTFTMEDWKADDSTTLPEKCLAWCTAYLWIVPARVQGSWRMADGALNLEQTFQMISGTFVSPGKTRSISGKVNGDRIELEAEDVRFIGQIKNNVIDGTKISGASNSSWKAERQQESGRELESE